MLPKVLSRTAQARTAASLGQQLLQSAEQFDQARTAASLGQQVPQSAEQFDQARTAASLGQQLLQSAEQNRPGKDCSFARTVVAPKC